MTLTELVAILRATGYPVAYSHFNERVSPPYITYLVEANSNFKADNKVYHKINNIRIELYTDKKDLQAESTLEQLLDDNELPYDPIETFIESENVFQRIYEIGVI